MKFLKVANKIFELGLTPNELKCYLYLASCQNALGAVTVRIATIQARCAIASPNTVRSALARLEAKQLITKKNRYDQNGQRISSQFLIPGIPGKWFRLEVSNLLFALDKSAFAVYLYLTRKKMSRSRTCPSQSAIAAAVGLARHTVSDALGRLQAAGFVLKAALWQGLHNLYTVLTGRSGPEKNDKKVLPPKTDAETPAGEQQNGPSEAISKIARFLGCVKGRIRRFLLDLTCAKIDHQYIDLTFTPKITPQKEKNRQLYRLLAPGEKCALAQTESRLATGQLMCIAARFFLFCGKAVVFVDF